MDALRQDIHIPKGVYCLLVWIGRNLPDFKRPKQALINAFTICPLNRFIGFALQNYNIFLIRARKTSKKAYFFILE
jgi:hypothetical protein